MVSQIMQSANCKTTAIRPFKFILSRYQGRSDEKGNVCYTHSFTSEQCLFAVILTSEANRSIRISSIL